LSVAAAGSVITAGSQLVLQPGARVDLYGVLVVEAGAKIIAPGTSDKPITFQGYNDAAGIIILGGSGDSDDSSTFSDIPPGVDGVPTYTATYGGSPQPKNVMTYCQFNDIGSQSEDVNALTLVGLSVEHTFRNLDVVNAGDDGVEIFAGSVNLMNVQITDALDDFFDVDDGWTGNVTGLTLRVTSTATSYKSLIEVGSAGLTTVATLYNVHFIDSTGADQVGTVTDYYTTSENAFNIRDSSSSLVMNQQAALSGTSGSTDDLPLQVSSAGPYTWAGTSFGLSSLTVPAAGYVVSAGSQLVLLPGATVTLNGVLVVEAGGKIIAPGTADSPIAFVGDGNDDSGIIILGGTGDASDTATFSDIPSGTNGVTSY
jgi:hypothetical protein